MLNLIGHRVGQYEILSLLGRGGMASVFRARQASMGREVAIKVILPPQDDPGDLAARFAREVRIVASLSHPHIIKVFDYGEQDEVLYLVMELLKGGNLTSLMRDGPLPTDTVVRILEQIASALDYAHSLEIIHRDLKPQNVLLDTQNNVHLTDFGLAKILGQDTSLSDSGVARGTPAYMSPEQWMNDPINARTDIYCLGIMLFQMLSGKLPFNAQTPYGMLQMHVNEPPPSISALSTDLPPGVDGVVFQALAKDPEDRYPSAGELVADFKSALKAQNSSTTTELPVASAVPANLSGKRRTQASERTQLQLPAKRQRIPLLMGSILALVVLLGGGAIALSGRLGGIAATQTLTSMPTSTGLLTSVSLSASGSKSPDAIGTPLLTPNLQTRVAETFAARPTPNEQQTVAAIVNTTDTAIAVASFTKTFTPTSTMTVTASATPTITFTPSPTTTPTDEPCSIYVSGQGDQQLANVRSGPGTIYPIYGTITPKDGKFKVIGQFVDTSTNIWWQIQYTEKLVGFVSAAFVTTEGSACQDSPHVTAPPPPPKTAVNTLTPSLNSGGSGSGGGGNGNGNGNGSATSIPPTATRPSIIPTLPLKLP